MIQNKFSELVFTESDVCDLVMKGYDTKSLNGLIIDDTVNLATFPNTLNPMPQWAQEQVRSCSVSEFHAQQQSSWNMPVEYKHLDIAEYVLSLCENQIELQRCGHELLLYQERGLFDLLRYLKYLVDIMQENKIIWGVGRGSSVASFVLYKLGVHRINSLYYELDVGEFLR